MHDPLEGVSSVGTIETGASADRLAAAFQPVLDAAVAAVQSANRSSSLYVYGSVATGQARPASSDVDLLTVDLPLDESADIAQDLSKRFSDLCREVAIAAAERRDLTRETDEAYGGRVFLKHYCVHLAGPDLHSALPDFAADARAARGFNGDIAQHARRWQMELDSGGDPARLGRSLARKTLLAVTGLVSVHDSTWTTDRATAAARWAEIEPSIAGDLSLLEAWSRDRATPDRESVEAALDGVVTRIVDSFAVSTGLWDPRTDLERS